MARGRSKVKIEEEDELEELDELDDLEDAADSVVEVEDDEDGDAEEVSTKKTRRKKVAEMRNTIGTRDLADALETNGKNLRVMLRDQGVDKNASGRYEWPSVKAALKELGFDSVEDAQEALAESRNKRLDILKESQAQKREALAASKPKKKKKPVVEDDEDEDEDDDE